MNVLERLEFEREEGFQGLPVAGVDTVEAVLNGSHELLGSGVVFAIEAILLDKLPQPLNEVEVGRITRQEQQLDVPRLGVVDDPPAMLVRGVVEHQRDGTQGTVQGPEFVQQLANRLGVDERPVGQADQLACHGVEGTEYIEPLAPGGGLEKHAGETPHQAQEGAKDKVSRVEEVDITEAGSGLVQQRFHGLFLNSSCRAGSALPGIGASRRCFIPSDRR